MTQRCCNSKKIQNNTYHLNPKQSTQIEFTNHADLLINSENRKQTDIQILTK